MGEEVFLLGFQLVPVCQVFGQINLKKTSTLYLSVLLYELPVFFPTGGRHSVSFNYVFVEGCYTVSDTHLFHRPERGLRLLVHLPDVGVLDGEDDKPSGVFSEQRFVFCLWTILTVWGFIFEAILQRARAQELNRKQLNIFFTSHSVWQGKLG